MARATYRLSGQSFEARMRLYDQHQNASTV